MELHTPKRFFKMGATLVEDPLFNQSFEVAWKHFVQANPLARHSIVFEDDFKLDANGNLVYEVPKLPARSNG